MSSEEDRKREISGRFINIRFSGLEIKMIRIPQNSKEEFFRKEAIRKAMGMVAEGESVVDTGEWHVLDDGGAEFVLKVIKLARENA